MIIALIFLVACAKTAETPSDGKMSTTSAAETKIACSKDSDCGETSSREVCYQRATVYRQTTRFICSNPGTADSFCTEDSSQKLLQDCGLREVCENGRCIIPPPSKCEESDDGIDEFEEGKVTIGLDTYYDECIDDDTLKEVYCTENITIGSKEIKCSKGCYGDECQD